MNAQLQRMILQKLNAVRSYTVGGLVPTPPPLIPTVYQGEPLIYDESNTKAMSRVPVGTTVHTSMPKYTGVVTKVLPGDYSYRPYAAFPGWGRLSPTYEVLVLTRGKVSKPRTITTKHVEPANVRLEYFTKMVMTMENEIAAVEATYKLQQDTKAEEFRGTL